MNKAITTFLEDLGFAQNVCPDGIQPDYLSVNENHVVSRDKIGNVVSRFGDIRWDFTHYTQREMRLNFKKYYDADKSKGKKVYKELKLCCFFFMFHPGFKKMRTVETASRDLFIFADDAIRKGVSFRDSLSDVSLLEEILVDKDFSDSQKYRKLACILSTYNRLGKLSAIFPSFDFFPSSDAYNFALKNAQLLKKNRKVNQTPVIPTRLFSEIIAECSYTLGLVFSETDFVVNGRKLLLHEAIEKLLMNSLSICLESDEINKNSACGFDNVPQKVLKSRRWSLRFSKSQESYWSAIRPFGIDNFKDLKTFFGYFFSCSRAITQIFTGMRFEESLNIPYNGLKIEKFQGETVHFVRSWTTKIESESARFASWVTSPLFVDFNKSIQIMARVFYSKYKAIDIDSVDQAMYPLLPALVGQTQTNPFFNYPPFGRFNTNTGWVPFQRYTSNIDRFLITKSDVDELYRQDPDRDWHDQGFRVGEFYNFASHQFRRSLVVYAARSGLVSLPSLQSNLQHLFQTMTAYYATGASYADDFILKEKYQANGMKAIQSMINEFREEVFNAETDFIWEEVVETDDILFGGYGSFIQRKKDSGDMPKIFESQSSIAKAIKSGKLAYKKTPLGGCCAVTPCEKAAFTSITACLLCESSVLNSLSLIKLEKTKKNLMLKLSQFDERSPFALQISKEIESINAVLYNRISIIESKDNV